jgi:hypothetical protein
MNAVLRWIAGLGAMALLVVAMAGPANAATSKVKLRNQATGTKLMTRDANGLVSMKPVGAANQIWTKTTTAGGYATYSQGTLCLTGRGLQGLPLTNVEKCVPGATKQQWRKGVSGDLQLRLNGLVAEVNTASAAFMVRIGLFTAKPNQKWFEIAA